MPQPQTPADIAKWLVETCAELGLGSVSTTDDFFAVGGTSMLAIKLIAKIEDTYGEDVLPPEDLFIVRRLEGVAAIISDTLAVAA
jgi:acyl carrier protein